MPPANDLHTVVYSLGGEDLGKCRRQETAWGKLRKTLIAPERTNEKHARYLAMDAQGRARMKARPGWIASATFRTGRRRASDIIEHGLITFDLDEATPEILDMLTDPGGMHPFRDYEYQLYTTRSHTPEAPRLRVVMPVTRTMSSDQWAAVTRYLAQTVDGAMEAVDHVSFRASQLMYKPSASSDQEFIEFHNRGKLVDPDEVLAPHPDWQDFSTLPQGARETISRQSAAKAEVPTEKRGIVGDWCRTYNVEEAIEKFLPDIYGPGDCHETGKPRYTYLKGTAANGVVVEDGGLFIYSHHGSDPCGNRLCNSFDMVRLHDYVHLDAAVHDENLPVTSLPSYKAMVERAVEDEDCKRSIIATRLALIEEHFENIEDEESDGDLGDGAGAKAAAAARTGERKRRKPPKDWEAQLRVDKAGVINCPQNIRIFIEFDRRLHDRIVWDELRNRVALQFRVTKADTPLLKVPNPPPGKFQRILDHTDEQLIRAILEYDKPGHAFLRVNPRDVEAACALIAYAHPVHEVRDYCETVFPEWDGIDRLSTFIARHLGERADAYTAAVGRLFLLGIVARAYEPGHKFDFMPIIQGGQGGRKSSYPAALFGHDWTGNLQHGYDDLNRMLESAEGKVVLEVGELYGMKKTAIERMKDVISTTVDKTRLAWGRFAQEYPRRFLMMGTTNDATYLTDPTGNRRFWPLTCPAGWAIDLDMVAAERRQLWAQATAEYKARRVGMPDKRYLPLYLHEGSPEFRLWEVRIGNAMIDDPAMIADDAEAWVARPVPLSQLHDPAAFGTDGEPLVIRTKTCAKEIAERGLGLNMRQFADRTTFNLIRGRIASMPGWETRKAKVAGYGSQRAFVLCGATEAELWRGYRVVGTYRAGEDDGEPGDDIL